MNGRPDLGADDANVNIIRAKSDQAGRCKPEPASQIGCAPCPGPLVTPLPGRNPHRVVLWRVCKSVERAERDPRYLVVACFGSA
jgi:hypothetical protein